MGKTNATSAKIIGALTLIVGILMLDSAGILSGGVIAAAGTLVLFTAGPHNTIGFNKGTIGLSITYGFLVIVGLGLSA